MKRRESPGRRPKKSTAPASDSARPAPKSVGKEAAKAPAPATKVAAKTRTAANPKPPAIGSAPVPVSALEEAQVKVSRIGKDGLKVLRPKSFDQAPVERENGFPVVTPELPASYGIDRLVLMVKDPDILFGYWEITSGLLASKAGEKRPGEEYREAIKLNWPARSLFDMNFALLPVDFSARNWYLRAPFPGLSYHLELGWLGDQGHFITLLRSNDAEAAESWDEARRRLRGQGETVDYLLRVSQSLGASEQMQIEEARFAAADWNMGSGSFSSTAAAKTESRRARGTAEGGAAPRKRANSLRVEARLQPGSRLRVDGRELVADAKGRVNATLEPGQDALTVELVLPGGETRAYTYDLAPGAK